MDSQTEEKLMLENIPDGRCKIIAKTIGVENFLKMCLVSGGSTIYIPKPDAIMRPVRAAKIREEFNGFNYSELARKYSVTERWVRQLCDETNQ